MTKGSLLHRFYNNYIFGVLDHVEEASDYNVGVLLLVLFLYIATVFVSLPLWLLMRLCLREHSFKSDPQYLPLTCVHDEGGMSAYELWEATPGNEGRSMDEFDGYVRAASEGARLGLREYGSTDFDPLVLVTDITNVTPGPRSAEPAGRVYYPAKFIDPLPELDKDILVMARGDVYMGRVVQIPDPDHEHSLEYVFIGVKEGSELETQINPTEIYGYRYL